MPRTLSLPALCSPARALALAAVLALGGCAVLRPGPPPRYGPPALVGRVLEILDVGEPSPAFYRERARLEAMGPELDPVLVGVVEDPSVDENVRANAVLLLADRRGMGALDLLRRHLVSSPSERIRVAAVAGLQRFVADSPQVHNALRAAAGDPSALVRLGVLQRLDVEDAPVVRALLAGEENPQVRLIAGQVLTLLEARGAPLVEDARGNLRTSGPDSVPQIVFDPAWTDGVAEYQVGALWVELPGAALIPLAQEVEVVDRVVPAFFDRTRSVVVFEAERQIRMRDLRTGETRTVARGIAPRVIPFTDRFVFVREIPGSRTDAEEGTVIDYEVLRASFAGTELDEIGRLRAVIRSDVHSGASPVRLMAVGETRSGFVLRGPGISAFALPGPFEGVQGPH